RGPAEWAASLERPQSSCGKQGSYIARDPTRIPAPDHYVVSSQAMLSKPLQSISQLDNRRIMKTTLATSLSLALLFTSTPLAQRRDMVIVKNKRVALVIGNAAYKESPLSNPVNDARDMSQLLRELGFEVIYKQNASQAEMKGAIREFGNNIVRG